VRRLAGRKMRKEIAVVVLSVVDEQDVIIGRTPPF